MQAGFALTQPALEQPVARDQRPVTGPRWDREAAARDAHSRHAQSVHEMAHGVTVEALVSVREDEDCAGRSAHSGVQSGSFATRSVSHHNDDLVSRQISEVLCADVTALIQCHHHLKFGPSIVQTQAVSHADADCLRLVACCDHDRNGRVLTAPACIGRTQASRQGGHDGRIADPHDNQSDGRR